MPLPPAPADRLLTHRRPIDVPVCVRHAGVSDTEARLSDVTTHDSAPATGELGGTHLTEPNPILPTAVVQVMAGERVRPRHSRGFRPAAA